MSACPFCGEVFTDCAKHAARAHKGQRISFRLAPLDTHYSVTIFEALDRLEDLAQRQSTNDVHPASQADFKLLAALIRALRQGAVKEKPAA